MKKYIIPQLTVFVLSEQNALLTFSVGITDVDSLSIGDPADPSTGLSKRNNDWDDDDFIDDGLPKSPDFWDD